LIFATGKTGTIGRHLSPNSQALEVNLKDSLFTKYLPHFGENDSLIHLAGIVGVKNVDSDPDLSYLVNVQGSVTLAEYFRKNSNGQFIYISTSHVYQPGLVKLRENADTGPASLYAKQKLDSENLLFSIFEKEPERLCVLRVFSILDWDVKPFTLGGGIQKLANENSEYKLQFCDDVRDFLTPRSTAMIIEKIAFERTLSGIVNLCSGTGLTIRQAASQMLNSAGFTIPHDQLKPGNSSIPYLVGDNSKLTEALPDLDLSWKPSIKG
jgi:nucleoside-diphosphate-sugar epimerase